MTNRMVLAIKVKLDALMGVTLATTVAKPVIPPKQKLSGNLKKVNADRHDKGTQGDHDKALYFVFHGKSRTPFLYVTLIFYTLFHFFSIVDVINYRKKLQDTGGLDGREKKQKEKEENVLQKADRDHCDRPLSSDHSFDRLSLSWQQRKG